MGNPRGFLDTPREKEQENAPSDRIRSFREFSEPLPKERLEAQASRCMGCGIPFCHDGCPLGNLIPEWNDLVYRGRMDEAKARLAETNNFPEVTGRICPAPCEASCVLNIEGSPVTIKSVERAIASVADLAPRRAETRSGKTVGVIGSGPAGLACAQELARKGHEVTLYERDDRIGGLLRYGIPDFKMEKGILDRRMEQMAAEGVTFRAGMDIGGAVDVRDLRKEHDALVLATGARVPRDLPIPGRDLSGVHFAMEFLERQNRIVAEGNTEATEKPTGTFNRSSVHELSAYGKRVLVIGGGDTGSDCIGTSIRQGALEVLNVELMPKPPLVRMPENPWPEWPLVLRTSSSHEEGAQRDFAVLTKAFIGKDGRLTAARFVRVEFVGGKLREIAGSEEEHACDLVLLAMGFTGPVQEPFAGALGLTLDARGNFVTDGEGRTNADGIFAAGDNVRGQSLVVWAIADGRRVANGVDRALRAG